MTGNAPTPRPSHHGKRALLAAAVLVVCSFEGFAPVAKHFQADPPGVITEGFGTTNYDLPGLKVGDTITKPRARALMATKLARKYLPPLRRCIHGFDAMPQPRQIAFLDAAYNLGSGRICRSFAPALNAGRVSYACDHLMAYVYANHRYLRGLARRRAYERKLCREGL